MAIANNYIQFNRFLLIVIACFTGIIGMVHHFVLPIPDKVQWIFFAVIIVFTGIPHGALDHEVAKQNSKISNQVFSPLKFHARYLVSMLIYGFIWYIFPTLSFYLFIMISAFHFGETDLIFDSTHFPLLGVLLQISYGLLILFIILFLHIDTVLPIIQKVNIFSPVNTNILQRDSVAYFAISLSFSFFLLTLIAYMYFCKSEIRDFRYLFAIILFVFICALILPLPLCFIIYFGLWHSIISLENIRQHLSKTKKEIISWKSLMIKSIPLTAVSLLGLFSIAYFWDLENNINLVIMALFIGISILTLPHLEVMSKMYFLVRKNKTG